MGVSYPAGVEGDIMVRFGIVGSGWRAGFFLRAARALQGQVEVAGLVARSPQRAAGLAAAFHVPLYPSISEMIAAEAPDFVVTSVSWSANPGVVRQLVEQGMPVLSETPPAGTVAEMQALWALQEEGARIQVAEQYWRQPHHAARLAFAHSGRLGRVSQVQVSAAHGYHGISLMRRFLGIGGEPATVSARRFVSPIVQGPSRQGPPSAEKLTDSDQLLAFFDFGDRLGALDFSGDQYFSWIRGQRLLVRGERGEIIDDRAVYLYDHRTPLQVVFSRHSAGPDGNLEGNYLKGIQAGERWWYRNPVIPAALSDDEIAIADLLLRMADYVHGGDPVYSLADACQDRYLDILAAQAAQNGQPIRAQSQPWSKVLGTAS